MKKKTQYEQFATQSLQRSEGVLLKDGVALAVGDRVTDFRGTTMIVAGWRKPRNAGSTGRVVLKATDGVYLGEFYPSVIGAAIVTERIVQWHGKQWVVRPAEEEGWVRLTAYKMVNGMRLVEDVVRVREKSLLRAADVKEVR